MHVLCATAAIAPTLPNDLLIAAFPATDQKSATPISVHTISDNLMFALPPPIGCPEQTLSVQIHEQSRKKEQLEALLRDERSASEQRRSKQTQEQQSLQSAVDQAQATASAGPVDESVYTEKIQSAMQQLYLQAGEVFVPAGEDSAHFDGSEVMSKIRALLRTAVTGGNGSPSRKG